MESKCGDADCLICTQVREIICPAIDPAYAEFLEKERKACMRRRQKNGATRTGPSTMYSPTLYDTFVTARVCIEAKPVRSAEVNNKRINISFLRSRYIFHCDCCHIELHNCLILACTAQQVTAFLPETASRESLVEECLTLRHEVLAHMRSFRRFHTIFMKMWDEKDKAVEELEKLKMGNKSNTDVVNLSHNDEQETTDKKSKKAAAESHQDPKHIRVKRARGGKITRRGDNA